MCTAYEVGNKKRGSDPRYTDPDAVLEILGKERQPRIVRPTNQAPVIMPDKSVRTMLWGFRIPVPGKRGAMRTVVNSREDKLEGRTWGESFHGRRCIIPASAFYEWVQRRGGMVPLRFERPDDHLTWIAGIWRLEEGRGECFSMITTEPNKVVSPVHDRMPAVLTDGQIPAYLAGELHEFGPSRVPLVYAEAENFLTRKKPPQATQGDLF